MYLLRSDLVAVPGAANELEALHADSFVRMAAEPGFVFAALGNALAYPDAYLSLVVWQSHAQAQAWRRGAQSRPLHEVLRGQSFMTPARPSEAYELLFELRAPTLDAAYLGLAERTVSEPRTQAAAFEETARRVSELRRQYGAGFVANGLARFLGGAGRYMAILLYSDQAAAAAIDSAPEIAAYRRAHPFGAFTGPAVLSDFELVHLQRASV